MRGRTENLPASLRGALIELFGEAADDVDLIEHSWRVRWHPRALATTRRNRIYLRGSIDEFSRDAELVLHEYFHVREQWQPGRLTRFRYLCELARRGYRNNCFEVEAREYVEKNLRQFRVLIARGEEPLSPTLSPKGRGSGALTPALSPKGRGKES